MFHKVSSSFALSMFLMLSTHPFLPAKDASNSNQFILIQAELSRKGIQLLEGKVHEGAVKARRRPIDHRTDPFLFVLYGPDEKVLFEETFRDPRRIYFDSVDESGELHGGMLEIEKAVFAVRFPYSPEAYRIDFFQRADKVFIQGEAPVSRPKDRIGSFTMEEVLRAGKE